MIKRFHIVSAIALFAAMNGQAQVVLQTSLSQMLRHICWNPNRVTG